MRPERGAKPWRPYPKQIETLVAAADGASIGLIAMRLGVPPTQVAQRLSDAYTRLGVKDIPSHRLSHVRRAAAIKICKDRGWWPTEEGQTAAASRWAGLTPEDVRKIRAFILEEGRPTGWAARLAEQFNVSQDTIYRVASGRSWKGIPW